MTTPIADGTYHIRNVLFPDTYLDLTSGLPYAAIDAWTSSSSTNLQWIVKNVGNNKISLENVTASGYYAGVTYLTQGAPLFGSPSPTYWTVEQVSTGIYNLEAAEGLQITQRLDGAGAAIYLGPLGTTASSEREQWTFTSV